MDETQTRKGTNPRLLLLIPAVLIIAKARRHRRAMMEQGWNGSGPAGIHYRHHRFGGPADETGPRAFRLPPRIESVLDAWHTRSHAASDTAGSESETGTATA